MLHYSCDRCNCKLDAEDDLRYVVKLESYAAIEPAVTEDYEDDRDHLLEVQEIIERIESGEEPLEQRDAVYRKQSYDLCANCYREYIKNPVGRMLPSQIEFSEN